MFFFEFFSLFNINIYKSNITSLAKQLIGLLSANLLLPSEKPNLKGNERGSASRKKFLISKFVFMTAKFFNRFLLLARLLLWWQQCQVRKGDS